MSAGWRWAVGMTAFGLAVAGVTYLATGSPLWAVVALLLSGVVANALVHPTGRSR